MADASPTSLFICTRKCSILWNPNLLLTVSPGTLWLQVCLHPSGILNAPESVRSKIRQAVEQGKVILQKHTQNDLKIPKDAFQGNSLNHILEDDYSLLCPIRKDEDRLAVYQDRSWLQEGKYLGVGDQVTIRNVPSLTGDVWGTLRYKGPLGDSDPHGLQFGVELHTEFAGEGTSSGIFCRQRYFQCDTNCAVFYSLFHIRKRAGPPSTSMSSSMTGQYSLRSDGPSIQMPQSPDDNMMTPPLRTTDYTSLPLTVEERVIWYSDSGPEDGTVKWIGQIPDLDPNGRDSWYAGVEFDSQIGRGTGRYLGRQLFTSKRDHASLVPVAGLLRYVDCEQQQQRASFPSAASASAHDASTRWFDTPPYTLGDQRDRTNDSTTEEDTSPKLRAAENIEHVSIQTEDLSLRLQSDTPRGYTVVNNSVPRHDAGVRDDSYPEAFHEAEKQPESSTQAGTSEKRNDPPTPVSSEHGTSGMTEVDTAHGTFRIGDTVAVLAPPRYGVIRWLGRTRSRSQASPADHNETPVIAGLEMEIEDEKCYTDGTFQDVRMFDCPPHRSFFIYITKCRQDSRTDLTN